MHQLAGKRMWWTFCLLRNFKVSGCSLSTKAIWRSEKDQCMCFPSCSAGFKIPSYRVLDNIVTTLSTTFQSGFCTWKLVQISKHDLLDPFQNVVCSAVLVIADVCSGGIETPRNISSIDISNN